MDKNIEAFSMNEAFGGKQASTHEEKSAFLHDSVPGAGPAVASVDMPQVFKMAGDGVGVRYIPLERVREVWEGNAFVRYENPENLNLFFGGLFWVLRTLELQVCKLSLEVTVPGEKLAVLADELAQVCEMARYAKKLADALADCKQTPGYSSAYLKPEPQKQAGGECDCYAGDGAFGDVAPVDSGENVCEGFHAASVSDVG